ncbi:MAG: hypothetical protein ABI855_19660, partial [Bacteroidota bacterium]
MQKLIQCFTILFFLAVLLNETAFSANEQFRSIASGNWNANSTWEMSTNGGSTWNVATSTPRDTSGAITVRNPNTVTVSANISADQLTINTGGILSISPGITFTLLDGSGTDFTLQTGASVTGNGTFQTHGVSVTMNIRGGSNFGAFLKVNSGMTTVADQTSPYEAILFGNVKVDSGATLNSLNTGSYKLYIYGNLINNGTITGSGSANTIKFYGASFANNGSITSPTISFDSTTTVSGTGSYTGGAIIVSGNGNVSLLNDVTFSLTDGFTINAGGIFNANLSTLTFASGTFTIFSGGTVASSGLIRTQNSVTLNLRTGSQFNANLNVASGTTIAAELSSPYKARLYGNVTIDAGATLSTNNTSSYTLFVYNNIINNGTITGAGGNNTLEFFGTTLTNNGSITSPVFSFDSTSAISGAGTFTGAVILVSGNGNVSLLNSVTFALSSKMSISNGGIFSANTHDFTFSSGMFEVLNGGLVASTGLIRTQNSVTLNLRTGSQFNANLNVASGTTIAAELSSPFNARLYGNVTIDAGATLSTNNTSSY